MTSEVDASGVDSISTSGDAEAAGFKVESLEASDATASAESDLVEIEIKINIK